jgi:hypothetical protein
VAERIHRGLEVALDGLDGTVSCVSREIATCVGWIHMDEAYGGAMLRWWAMSLPSSRVTRP